jgi:Arc/MetJ family transcription regulator
MVAKSQGDLKDKMMAMAMERIGVKGGSPLEVL